VGREQVDRHGLAEDRVAEELQPLVVRRPALLIREGAVRAKVVTDSQGTELFLEYKGRKVADI
jgi:hypothetical protein